MANELDEMTGPINEKGRDVNVIDKQIPITVGWGSKFFEIMLWVLFIVPGIIFTFRKIKAGKYLSQLQQKIQHDASQIDNYLEQRVVILQNTAKILDKAIDLDKDTFVKIAQMRAGGAAETRLNEVASSVENVNAKINIALEAYPELKAHAEIADAMQQNSYLQREITAAREVYNDAVARWNYAVYEWPAKQIVAAKRGYTTRVPFIASKETKDKARDVFF